MEKKCCICGSIFEGYGNNPLPIKSGVCCDKCNETFVFPARLYTDPTKRPITYVVCPTKEEYIIKSKSLTKKDFYNIGVFSVMTCFFNDENQETVVLVPGYVNHKE